MKPFASLILVAVGVFVAAGCSGPTTTKTVSTPDSDKPAETVPAGDPSTDSTDAAASGEASGPTGQVVRAQLILLSQTDLGAEPPKPIGIPIGARAGACTNVDPEPERAGLIAAVKDSDPKAADVDLSNPEVLVADCGDTYAAIAKWGSATTNLSIDQFSRTADGDWAAVDSDSYAPCGLPPDVLKLWKLDGVSC